MEEIFKSVREQFLLEIETEPDSNTIDKMNKVLQEVKALADIGRYFSTRKNKPYWNNVRRTLTNLA